MRSLKLTWIFPVTCLVLLSSPVLAQRTSNEHGRARAFRNGKLKRSKAFGDLPLTFEENVGQADSRVQFITRGRGYSLFFTGTEAVALLRAPSQTAVTRLQRTKQKLPRNLKQAGKSDVFRMRLLNSNERAKVVGIGRMQGTTNYLIGNDRRKWHAGVHTYTKVQYSQVYPGIDLIYYGKQGQLEYDFVVRPGVDPKAISLGFDGAKTKAIEPGGDLIAELDGGRVRLKKPTIYQTIRGKRTSIDGNYSVNKSQGVTVDVGPYDHTQLLIIDPVLVYSTYLGGSGDNEGIFGLSVDAQGNTYVAGFTDSSDFPIVGDSISPAPSGNIVSFVSKLNPTGTGLIYSTYIGGTGGDWPGGLAVDANGYAYVAGYTGSVDFPVTANNAFQTAMGTGATANSFVTKLDVDGQSLVYSTYLGGGTTDWAIGIAVDTNQNAYVAGFATSGTAPAFPTTANALQTSLGTPNGNGFVARLDTTKSGTNSLLYSTFLGGTITTPDEWDQASAIAVDGNQNVYVSGMVSSLDFPITPQTAFQPTLNKTPDNPNAFSAFLTQIDTNKLGAAGLIYSTYLGGTGNCGGQASHVVLDSFGGVWVVGGEGCADFPTTTGVPNSPSGKAFVAKFDTAKWQSASLVCSTLVGGSGGDWAEVIALDPNGDPYIGGWTRSTDFPVTPGALQSTFGGSGENSFLAALSFDASEIIYASYFGGSGSNWNDYLYGLAIDQNYNIHIAGATGSPDFQTTPGAFQVLLNGNTDAFIAQLTALPLPIISSASPSEGGVGRAIDVHGSDFGNQQNDSTITISGLTAQVNSWSDTDISVVVPQISYSGPVVVTVGGLPSNPFPFQFLLAARSNPQAIYISPDEMSLTVGDIRKLKLVDAQGNEIADATWSIDRDTVAALVYPPGTSTDTTTSPSLQGLAPGETIITATTSLGTAQGLARVFAAGQMPVGVSAWSVYPDSTNNWISSVVKGQPVNPGDPDLYASELLSSGGTAIRALDESGQHLWRQSINDYFGAMVGTADGGLLLPGNNNLVKLSATGATAWSLSGNFVISAVGYDGTVYGSDSPTEIVVIDGNSGTLKYRYAALQNDLIINGTTQPAQNAEFCGSISPQQIEETSPAVISPLVVATDGKAYFLQSVKHETFSVYPSTSVGECLSPNYLSFIYGQYSSSIDVSLVQLTPNGPGAVIPVRQGDGVHTNSPPNGWCHAGQADFGCNAVLSRSDDGTLPPDQGTYFIRPNDPNSLAFSATLDRGVAPDGAGGVFAFVEASTDNQPIQPLMYRVVDGAVQYQTTPPNGPASVALAENGTALFGDSSGFAVFGMDVASGSALWNIPNSHILSATDDGGFLMQNIDYNSGPPVTTITQVDQDGTLTGTSVTLPGDFTESRTEIGYFFAGHLLAQDQNSSAVQDIPLPTFPAQPGMVFPVIDVGNNSNTRAARGVSVREFAGDSPRRCTGYDDRYHALMVPQTPNSNTLQIRSRGHDVTVVLSGSNVSSATFTPGLVIPGDGQFHQLTVSGGSSTVGTFQINAYSSDGTLLGTPFQIDVKPRLNETVRFSTITDVAAGLLMPPVNIPTLNSLQTELNRIFLRQTNVQFSVASGGNFDYHYDTDGDKKLHYDVNLNGKGCYDCQANSELGGLVSAFFADPVRTAWRSDPSSFFAFYVNQISKEGVGGFSIPLRRDLPAIVAVEWPTPKTNGYLENLTAHEFGHILGRGAILTVSGAQIQTPSHNTKSSDYLMYPNNPNGTPCRISRDDWNIMNFVQGSAIPGTVVPNP